MTFNPNSCSLSPSLCSGPTGRSPGVRADLSVVPQGRGVCHGKFGILPRGAGTRWQAERGQRQNKSAFSRRLDRTYCMNPLTSVCRHRTPHLCQPAMLKSILLYEQCNMLSYRSMQARVTEQAFNCLFNHNLSDGREAK